MAGSDDVSQNLDILAQVPGDMLGRDEKTWARIAGGTIGHVLASNGPGLLPSWQPLGAGGGGQVMSGVTELTVSASLHATKGMFLDPVVPLTVSGAIIRFNATSGGSYKAMLVKLAGTTLDAIMATSPVLSGFPTATRREFFDFGANVALTPGTVYAVLHVRTDNTSTTASGAWASIDEVSVGPWAAAFGLVFMDSINPAVGNTFTKTQQDQVFAVNFLYRA